MTIGDQLKFKRAEQGVTQKWLADKTGLSVDTINKLENGKNINPTIYVLRQLSKALDYYKFEL